MSFTAGAALVALAASAAVFGEVDQTAAICNPGYAKTHRPDRPEWEKLRRAVYQRENVPYDHKSYEVDHRIPISLGGSNDLSNLQLQSWTGPWNARDKDRLELELWRQVCREHRLPLATAQNMLGSNWQKAYLQIFGQAPADANVNYYPPKP